MMMATGWYLSASNREDRRQLCGRHGSPDVRWRSPTIIPHTLENQLTRIALCNHRLVLDVARKKLAMIRGESRRYAHMRKQRHYWRNLLGVLRGEHARLLLHLLLIGVQDLGGNV